MGLVHHVRTRNIVCRTSSKPEIEQATAKRLARAVSCLRQVLSRFYRTRLSILVLWAGRLACGVAGAAVGGCETKARLRFEGASDMDKGTKSERLPHSLSATSDHCDCHFFSTARVHFLRQWGQAIIGFLLGRTMSEIDGLFLILVSS